MVKAILFLGLVALLFISSIVIDNYKIDLRSCQTELHIYKEINKELIERVE